MELDRTVKEIRRVLAGEPYGLTSRQIAQKLGNGVKPRLVGMICSLMEDVERVNSERKAARWRLMSSSPPSKVRNY
ncbi:MAG: hypothetical protein DRP11_02720 [Candidatus Aenigmatarchaeota archaeon]|nr:MAG: hypothetical protein DRP11_02720 [Candidatus Aenigmarchaeota archaeon]